MFLPQAVEKRDAFPTEALSKVPDAPQKVVTYYDQILTLIDPLALRLPSLLVIKHPGESIFLLPGRSHNPNDKPAQDHPGKECEGEPTDDCELDLR